MGWIKSNVGASITALALGVTSLGILVWLSPKENTHATSAERPNSSGSDLGSSAASPSTEAASSAMSTGHDPFKAQMLKQAASPSAPTAKTTPTTTSGIDPFKEKLLQQSQQAKEASISPFGNASVKP